MMAWRWYWLNCSPVETEIESICTFLWWRFCLFCVFGKGSRMQTADLLFSLEWKPFGLFQWVLAKICLFTVLVLFSGVLVVWDWPWYNLILAYDTIGRWAISNIIFRKQNKLCNWALNDLILEVDTVEDLVCFCHDLLPRGCGLEPAAWSTVQFGHMVQFRHIL